MLTTTTVSEDVSPEQKIPGILDSWKNFASVCFFTRLISRIIVNRICVGNENETQSKFFKKVLFQDFVRFSGNNLVSKSGDFLEIDT